MGKNHGKIEFPRCDFRADPTRFARIAANRSVAFRRRADVVRGLASRIDAEARAHGDVLVLPDVALVDVYRELARKVLAFHAWAARSHPRAPFVGKIDDDCYANLRLIAQVRYDS